MTLASDDPFSCDKPYRQASVRFVSERGSGPTRLYYNFVQGEPIVDLLTFGLVAIHEIVPPTNRVCLMLLRLIANAIRPPRQSTNTEPTIVENDMTVELQHLLQNGFVRAKAKLGSL